MGVVNLFLVREYLREGRFALCMDEGGSRDYYDFITHSLPRYPATPSLVIFMQYAYANELDAHMRNDL